MTDTTTWMWTGILLGIALGFGAGFVLSYWVLWRDKRAQQLEDELRKQRADFEAYRTQVDDHFLRTSELFQEMTARYRDIYEHLATGAQSLCSDRVVPNRLNVPEQQPLMEDRVEAGRTAETRSASVDAGTPPSGTAAEHGNEPGPGAPEDTGAGGKEPSRPSGASSASSEPATAPGDAEPGSSEPRQAESAPGAGAAGEPGEPPRRVH